MPQIEPKSAARPVDRRLLGLGAVVAALAITTAFWLSNAASPQASECPAQPQAAASIDAAAQGELAALMATALGRGYGDMGFTGPDGQPSSIADFAGKKLLVNFWASWCVPCREEMPALDALAAKYNGEDFMVLPINLDIGANGKDKAQQFLTEAKVPNLPLYADSSFSAFERLKTQGVAIGLPATLLLDETGCEIAVLQGPAEWASPDGERVVEALLGL